MNIAALSDKQIIDKKGSLFEEMRKYAFNNGEGQTEEAIAKYRQAEKDYDALDAEQNNRLEAAENQKRFEARQMAHDQDAHYSRNNEGKKRREGEITFSDEENAILGFMRAQYNIAVGDKCRAALELFEYNPFQNNEMAFGSMNKWQFRHLQREAIEGLFPDFDPDMVKYRDAGTTAGHGEVISPGFLQQFTRSRLQFGDTYRYAHVHQRSSGAPLHWPILDDTVPNPTAGQVDEVSPSPEDTEVSTVELVLNAWKHQTGVLKMSAEVLQDSEAINWVSEIPRILGGHMGRILAPLYANGLGPGSKQPRGFVPNTEIKHTAAANNAVTGTDLINLQGALDDYWENGAAFYFNKKTRTNVRLQTLSDGQFIWQPGLQAGVPDRLLGDPVRVIHEIPDIGATARSTFYGNMYEHFKIGDVGGPRLYALDQIYRVSEDSTGWILFQRTDSGVMPHPAATNPPLICMDHPA